MENLGSMQARLLISCDCRPHVGFGECADTVLGVCEAHKAHVLHAAQAHVSHAGTAQAHALLVAQHMFHMQAATRSWPGLSNSPIYQLLFCIYSYFQECPVEIIIK